MNKQSTYPTRNINEVYFMLREQAGFSSAEIEDKKRVRQNSEPRDMVCILLDAFGFDTIDIAHLIGVHPNTVYQSLNRERQYRRVCRGVYLSVVRQYGKIFPDRSMYDRIIEALEEMGLTQEEVRFLNNQGKKNHQIHAISMLYKRLKGEVCMKSIEDFTCTSHTSIHKYLKQYTS